MSVKEEIFGGMGGKVVCDVEHSMCHLHWVLGT